MSNVKYKLYYTLRMCDLQLLGELTPLLLYSKRAMFKFVGPEAPVPPWAQYAPLQEP